MVFGGTSAKALSDTRTEILGLSAGCESARSEQNFRKALQNYASVVSIPRWLFQCNKCSLKRGKQLYYKQLSFDGFQVGHKKSKLTPIHQEAIEGDQTVTVFRDSGVTRNAYLIRGRAARSIVFDALRAKPAPVNIHSTQFLCDVIFKTRIGTKEMVKAAFHCIRLFDQDGWVQSGGSTNDLIETFDPSVVRVFKTIIDARRIGRVLAIILKTLNNDLLKPIEGEDRSILGRYQQESEKLICDWITALKAIGKRSKSDPLGDQGGEIAKLSGHEAHLQHHSQRKGAIRRLRWEDLVLEEREIPCISADYTVRLHTFVRKCGNKRPTYDACVKVMMLLAACFMEPACVWIRKRSFSGLRDACRALRALTESRGISQLEGEIEESEVSQMPLLREGTLSIAYSTEGGSYLFSRVLADLLEHIPQQHQKYVDGMYRTKGELPSGTMTPFRYNSRWFSPSSLGGEFLSNNDNKGGSNAYNNMEIHSPMSTASAKCVWDGDVLGPDFPKMRAPPVPFGSDNTNDFLDCSKIFTEKKVFTPGTFLVMCSCSHAKCVAVIALKTPEGCRAPLHFIMERCRELPEIVVYDYSCGTLKSALSVSPYVVENTSFVVDRFHFKTHSKCSLAMHPDAYEDLRGRNTSSQEQRNSLFRPLQFSFREMGEQGFKNMTALAHALHNARAMYHDHIELSGNRSKRTTGWTSWLRNDIRRRKGC